MIDYDDAWCRAGGWMEGYGGARIYTPFYLAEFMVKCRRAGLLIVALGGAGAVGYGSLVGGTP